jgi:uncharacterized membrane protein YqjE
MAERVPPSPPPASPPPASPPPGSSPPRTDSDDRSVGELVLDISEQTSGLIREEIELAKAEVSEKVNKILRGSVAGIAAAVFVLMALAMFMHGIAWLLNDLFFEDNVWLGFLIEGLFWLVVGIAVGLFAYRSFQAGAPPTPDMAIEEAKRAKEQFEAETSGGGLASEPAGPERTPRP